MCVKGKARSGNRFVDSSPFIDWRLKAACREGDPEMWEAGGVEQVGPLLNARRICNTCPVREQCERSATKADLQYSMRAGKWPLLQPKRPRGRPVGYSPVTGQAELSGEQKASRLSMLELGKCKNDHPIDSPADLSSGGRCRVCENLDKEKARRERGAVPKGTATHCREGHEYTPENTYTPPSNPGKRECIACRRVRKQRKAAKVSA